MKADMPATRGACCSRSWILAGAAACAALLWSASGWGQGAQDPVVYRPAPGRAGKPVQFPAGEVLLVQLLQGLADATGETVYYKGTAPPEKTISLPRAIDDLDEAAATEILARAGHELSGVQYRGKQVKWVQERLAPPKQKGKILRGGDRGQDRASEPPQAGVGKPPAEAPAPRGQAALKLYRREEGSGPRYAVVLETDSREEAEEAMSLLGAQVKSRKE